ncbi:hypothetical protein KKD52_14770 [Myxococcota bacterium]|nr:hypothetical protein [Myxococcota bacterium]MBU1411813.1 hypothetical protein [Myxococcota bacterium]MBU1511614.1 hypothetical protein [Myxococcota bacterium]
MDDYQFFTTVYRAFAGSTWILHRLPVEPPSVTVDAMPERHAVTMTWTSGRTIRAVAGQWATYRARVDDLTLAPLHAQRLGLLTRWYAARVASDAPAVWSMSRVELVLALGLASHKADALFETIGGRHE